jgi:hypothetical protein
MSDKSFVIDKVAWSTNRKIDPPIPNYRDKTIDYFYSLATFFQSNGLTRRILVNNKSEIDDDFEIHSDDITDEGMKIMKVAYTKWLARVDQGMDPYNVTILEKALAKVRGTQH